MIFYFKDIEVKQRENVERRITKYAAKTKVWLNFLKIKHANSGISMRN